MQDLEVAQAADAQMGDNLSADKSGSQSLPALLHQAPTSTSAAVAAQDTHMEFADVADADMGDAVSSQASISFSTSSSSFLSAQDALGAETLEAAGRERAAERLLEEDAIAVKLGGPAAVSSHPITDAMLEDDGLAQASVDAAAPAKIGNMPVGKATAVADAAAEKLPEAATSVSVQGVASSEDIIEAENKAEVISRQDEMGAAAWKLPSAQATVQASLAAETTQPQSTSAPPAELLHCERPAEEALPRQEYSRAAYAALSTNARDSALRSSAHDKRSMQSAAAEGSAAPDAAADLLHKGQPAARSTGTQYSYFNLESLLSCLLLCPCPQANGVFLSILRL